MKDVSAVRVAALLGLVVLAGFAILCCVTGVFISWRADPHNSRAPSDQELIAAFHDHHADFERMRQVKSQVLRHVAKKDSDVGSAAPDEGSNKELSKMPPILTIGVDYDGTTRFVVAEGEFMAVGSGWGKGITYIPGDPSKKGNILPDLDNARKLPPGVYIRQIEPHWFVFYQRDE
jgi:hypothetical protein